MLLRARLLLWASGIRALLGFLCLYAAAACLAQQTPPAPTIRYHFGDDPRWADPAFDDLTWPVAQDGYIPVPPFHSDGFVWIRVHIPVPAGVGSPLGIRQLNPVIAPAAEEIYVNGRLIGSNGRVPPDPVALAALPQSVFPLARESVAPGDSAVVALRSWTPPVLRVAAGPFDGLFEIDRLSVLVTAARERIASHLLPQLPLYALFLTLIFAGLGLLLLWRLARTQELLLFAFLLMCAPVFIILDSLTEAGLLPIRLWLWSLLLGLPQCAGPVLQYVFIWRALLLPLRKARNFLIGASILSPVSAVLATWFSSPTPLILGLMHISTVSALVRDAGMCAFLLWAIRRRPSNRLLAFLLLLPPLFSLLGIIAELAGLASISSHLFQLFRITLLLALYAIAALLAQRAWRSWRSNNALRVEMEAAREVQQQLVPAALPVIPAFKAGAAYIPAAEVGGDFYQVLVQRDNSTLIVVGDVSGKGLKAAMKGALAIGAIRAIAAETLCPGELLKRLNRELVRAHDGGFITCICGLVSSNGALTLANAGHLAPYRDGTEVPISNGLPLGITEHAEFEETSLRLAPGDSLTFLSDGVIEARNPAGQLFGFERTQAISAQPDHDIAAAAQEFGQEDDITVLTLTFTQM